MPDTARILIVEDQYFVAVDCELYLREAGFECTGPAATAADAIELAESGHPDLIIMDINLIGQMDGVQAAIAIYERLGIRCIFASGQADAAVRAQAEPAHPLSWLNKPYTPEELVRAVNGGLAEVRCALPTAADHDSPSTALH